nr:reverse transcriptase domain-containing protein [Tanacetum cinerariifolium]
MDIKEELGADKSTGKGSNDTEEMINVISSIKAANILSSGGLAVSHADGFPTAGVPTVSGSFPTFSAIFTTASVKKKLQEQIDAHVAREMEEEFAREYQRLSEQVARDYEIARIHAEEELKLMIEGLDRSNEVIAKHLSKYEQAEANLSVGEKIELIKIKLDQGSSKRVKISHTSRSKPSKEQQFKGSEGVYEEELKGMVQLVPVKEVYLEAIQLWILVKETFSIKQSTRDKEKELWVELKRLFKPDSEDQLWTYDQAFMDDPLDWKLYDTCGVHHVSTKNQEIFMLVEKDYPLRKRLATMMISNKLQDSEQRMMTSIEEVNLRVSYQAQVCRQESKYFYTQLLDAQTDRRDVRLEIDVARGQRTAYETKLQESVEDLAVTQMMRIHALEARAQTDMVEVADSSCYRIMLVTRQGTNDAMNPESIQAMIDQEIQRNSTHTQGDSSQSSDGGLRRPVQPARAYSYTDFMKCQPLNFKGTESIVGLSQWLEKMETVFHISGYVVDNQVKVKGNDVAAYTQRFKKLALMCTKFLADETEKVDKYTNGLPDNIHGNVMSARPKTLDETIELANDLVD